MHNILQCRKCNNYILMQVKINDDTCIYIVMNELCNNSILYFAYILIINCAPNIMCQVFALALFAE